MTPRDWTRRELLGSATGCGLLAWGGSMGLLSHLLAAPAAAGRSRALAELIRSAPAARFWASTATARTLADCMACHDPAELPAEARHSHARTTVRCRLCARNCLLAEGERGRCRARIHVGGELKSLVYGRPVAVHVDPIEKKPFYHFLPGAMAFSLATAGCPLSCKFCQNWEISQALPEALGASYVPPEKIVAAAGRRSAPVVAFTYNEPTVFAEYLLDIARLAREAGLRPVLVSCGFMNREPLAEMCDALDAIKIDLKGYSEDFYRKVCDAELQPVLRSIRQVAKSRAHLELVNLVVPTLNDSPAMLRELAKWVMGEVGPDVPVHFTRFHPDYQLPNLPPTPVATLERAREIALEEGLRYAFVGNVPGHPGNHTYCPGCGEVVIDRRGFFVMQMRVEGGRCGHCGHPIAGVWG